MLTLTRWLYNLFKDKKIEDAQQLTSYIDDVELNNGNSIIITTNFKHRYMITVVQLEKDAEN